MRWLNALIIVAAVALRARPCGGGTAATRAAEGGVSFARDVAPILLKQCQSCHGPDKAKGRFRVDTFQRLMKAGKSDKPPIAAGRPQDSELFRLIVSDDEDERMPQKADRLPDAQIQIIRSWIEADARFDGPDPSASLASIAPAEHPAPPASYARPVPITALALSPTNGQLAASGYREVTLWGPADGKLLRRVPGMPERIAAVAFSPDGKFLAVAAGTPGVAGELVLCEASSDAPPRVLERIADMMLTVRFSPDGARLAAGGADNAVRIFDVATGRRERLIEQHADWVSDVAFSPDGARIATASRDRSSRVFDVKTGEMEAAYLKHEEPLVAVAWSDDGAQVFSAGRDRKVHVWKSADAKPVGEITGFGADLLTLRCGLGLLFTSSADGIVRAYSQDKRELVRQFPPAPDWVYCLAVDAKSRRLIGGCYNGQVLVWDLADGKLLKSFVANPGRSAAH